MGFPVVGGCYTRMMKINTPQIAAQLDEVGLSELQEGDIEDALLRDIDATNCLIIGLEIMSARLEKVILTAAQLGRVSMRDMVAKQTDFSAAHLANGALNRCEFVDCRMTGVDFSRTALHDITFRGCKLDMANFRFANLRRVRFVECTFVDTDFLSASLYDVVFESCTLEKTIFHQAKCKQVDLRTSDLYEIHGWASLKGVVIDSAQLVAVAPYLAHELGIVVK